MVCESCIEALEEDGYLEVVSIAAIEAALALLGAEIADHLCDDRENPPGPDTPPGTPRCRCACNRAEFS